MNITKYLKFITFVLIITSFFIHFSQNISFYKTLKLDFSLLFVCIIFFLIKYLIQSLINFYLVKNLNFEIPILEAIEVTVLNTIGNLLGPFKIGSGIKFLYFKKKYDLKLSKFLEINTQYSAYYLIGSYLILQIFVLVFENTYKLQILTLIILTFLLLLIFNILTKKFRNQIIKIKKYSKILVIFQSLLENSIILHKFKLLVLSVSQLFISFFITYYFFRVLYLDNSFLDSVYINLLSQTSAIITLSPGNIGFLEAVLILFKNLINLSTNEVIVLSLSMRLTSIFSLFLINLIIYIFNIVKKFTFF